MKNTWDKIYQNDIYKQGTSLNEFHGLFFKKNMKVLDIGCGTCAHLSFLRKKYGICGYGIDISPTVLGRVKDKKIKTFLGNSEKLPFNDNMFDVVYSLGVIEHTNTQKSLSESYRVLKKGGVAMHTVPNLYSMWTIIRPIKKLVGRWKIGYEQSFSPNKLKKMFTSAGFKNITWYTIGFNNYKGCSGILKKIDDVIHNIFKSYGFFIYMKGEKK